MNQHILILGATSSIARATAMAFAAKGDILYLAGRDSVELERISTDINIRFNTKTFYGEFDIENLDSHPIFFEKVLKTFPELNGIVFAIGYMGESIPKTLHINFNYVVLLLEKFAEYLKNKKSGFIIGISSCAGDRGRQSNYIYGAAKGGLSLYLQGLRNKLFKDNVRVITIKPGFVDTQMTFGLPGLFLVAKPDKIGNAIANSIYQKSDIIYLPRFWKYIMLIIRHIPEFIFKRMSL
jgi:decaprenylphospho-beta-D-erythro-pentofuranosid-2-ulose 2-reductase